MSDIFISYSRADRERVKPLAEALKNTCGWSVWWDPYIPAGKTFDDVIEAALDEARCVVVVWSQASIDSDWVKIEASEGRERGILVPVSIDNVRIPLTFRRIQTENFTDWGGNPDSGIFRKLRADIANMLGEVFLDNTAQYLDTANQRPEMVRIASGKFLMGSPEFESDRSDDEKLHEVFVGSFAIGKFPVTFAEYYRFCEETGSTKPNDEGWGRGNRPVINVSWEDACDYAEWLSRSTDKDYRLPTEAEWEYAARGGTQTAFWWGDKFEKGHINSVGCHEKTTPVDVFKPNPFGLYDMLGNVWEWAGSVYKDNYDGSEKKCAQKEGSGLRVIRGGSWTDDSKYARSANRLRGSSVFRNGCIGFRLAQD